MGKIALDLDRRSKSPLYRQVSEAICGAIEDGRLRPEDRLPTQAELARKLRLNPLTIGKGYNALKQQGVIVQRRGAGSFVSPGAADILGIPNRRALRNVAFVFPNVMEGSNVVPSEDIQLRTLAGVASVFETSHTNLCYFPFEPVGERLSDTVRTRMQSFDGVISQLSVSQTRKTEQLAQHCRALDIPLVTLGHRSPLASVPGVLFNRTEAVYKAVSHLVACGYRSIGYIGDLAGSSAEEKQMGCMRALVEHRLTLDGRCVIDVSGPPARAYAEIGRLARTDDLPEAFFVDTEDRALEVLHALQENRVPVPDRVALCCYEDSPKLSQAAPPVTAVYLPRYEMGAKAAEILLHGLDDGQTDNNIILDSTLRVRESTRGTH